MTATTHEKVKVITPESGLRLIALDANPGDFIGLDVKDSHQRFIGNDDEFIVARVGERGLRRVFAPLTKEELVLVHTPTVYTLLGQEDYVLHIPGGFLSLKQPTLHSDDRTFYYEPHVTNAFPLSEFSKLAQQPHYVESAYVGEEEILCALNQSCLGFDFYSGFLEFEFKKIRQGEPLP